MSLRLEVLARTPRSGATEELLQHAIDRAAHGGRALFLASNSQLAADVGERLRRAALDPAVVSRIRISTPVGMARELVRRYRPELPRVIDEAGSKLLLSEAAEQVLSGREDVRYARREVLQSALFLDDLGALIEELKRLRVDPGALSASLAGTSRAGAEVRALADVYSRYQELVEHHSAVDVWGVVWVAVEALRAGGGARPEWSSPATICVDEAQDYTPLELDLVAGLADGEADVLVAVKPGLATLGYRGAVGDPVEYLAGAMGVPPPSQPPPPERTPPWLAFAVLAARAGIDVPSPSAVPMVHRVFAESDDELVGLAYSIRALAADGVPLGSIAVIVRTTDARREVACALEDHFVPTTSADGDPRLAPVEGLLRALLTLALVAGETISGCEPDAVNSALSCLVALVATDPADAVQFAQQLHEAESAGGAVAEVGLAGELLASARGIVARCRERKLDVADTVQALLAAMAGGRSIAQGLARVGGDHLLELLGLATAHVREWEELSARQVAIADALAVVAQFREGLRPAPEPGGVAVLTPFEARGRTWLFVFLPCLEHHTFPQPLRVRRILPRADMELLAGMFGRGAVRAFASFLEQPEEALADEARLFLLALSRATERCVLSCHLSQGGAPTIPSPYFEATLPPDVTIGRPLLEAGRAWELALGAGATPEWMPTEPDAGAEPPADFDSREEAYTEPRSPVPVLAGQESHPRAVTDLEVHWVCPRRFFFQRVAGLDDRVSAALGLGLALHRALATLARTKPQARIESAEEIVELVAEQRDIIGFDSAAAAEFALLGLQTTLATLEENGIFPFGVDPRIVEYPVQFEVPEPGGGRTHRLRGIADAVHYGVRVIERKKLVHYGERHLIDYKTGRPPTKPEFLRTIRRWDLLDTPEESADPEATSPQKYQLPLYLHALRTQEVGEGLRGVAQIHIPPHVRDPKPQTLLLTLGPPPDSPLSVNDLGRIAADAALRCGLILDATSFEPAPADVATCAKCPFRCLCDAIPTDADDGERGDA